MRFEESFPAVPLAVSQIRRAMGRFARECGFPEEMVGDVALAVSEAASNAVLHAYEGTVGTIDVSATCARDELTLVIADRGSGLVPRPNSPGLGLGLPIIATVTTRMEVVARDGGTAIHMVFADQGRGGA